jgi:hypothetical protein
MKVCSEVPPEDVNVIMEGRLILVYADVRVDVIIYGIYMGLYV